MAINLDVLVLGQAQTVGGFIASLSPDYAATWERVDDEAGCRAKLEQRSWDLIACLFDGAEAPSALRALRDREQGVDPPVLIVVDRFEDAAEAAQRLGATVCLRAYGHGHVGPAIARVVREHEQRRARFGRAAFEAGQQAILEHIAEGRPLPEVLEEIVLLVERQSEGMLCSILLLDRASGVVRHGAAPHLPRPLVEGVHGAPIGPNAGSCGAAAYLGETVVIEDIGTHPNWVAYRHLVLPAGLRACWSSPIFAKADGVVLGTFAMYYYEARAPRAAERAWVARATHLAAIAISRDRAERAASDAEARYRQIVDTAYEGIWLLDADGRTLFVNRRTTTLLGYATSEMLGRPIVEFMDPASRTFAEGGFLEQMRLGDRQHEFRFRRRDGALFWALVSGSPIRDEAGQAAGALCMVTDISELKRTEEALRQSEAEFRAVFENAATGLALLGADGRVIRSNPALQRFLGFADAELAQKRLVELLHPDDRPADDDLSEVLSGRTSDGHRMEKRYTRKNGDVVWGRLSVSPTSDSKGEPPSHIIMVEDVTERRQLEDAVRASERLRSLMYSAVTDVLFYLEVMPVTSGGAYRFLSVNPAFTRATGLSEAQIIGRTVAEVIPEPSLSTVLDHYARAIQERRTVTWDEVTPYPAGKKYGEVSITPIYDASGNCTNLVGTVHDVTQRRQAEERVAAQAALLDKANDAILLVGLDGTIAYWNQGAERVYGWRSVEALGRSAVALIEVEGPALDEAKRQLLEQEAWSGELNQRTKAGRTIIVDASWTLIRDQDGGEAHVLAIGTDVTERKKLERQVFHTQRLHSAGLLAGGIAHDFNNLLLVVLGNAEQALEELSPAHPARASVLKIKEASVRASDLARRMLTFSREHEPQRAVTQLGPLVIDALELLASTVPAGIVVETHIDPDAPAVRADATQIHQIVMNLGTNALHAMGHGPGRLSVKIERRMLIEPLVVHGGVLPGGPYACLSVVDTGAGMDADTVERIFDPFFTTKSAGEGTGLGLSVVNSIVRNHQGGLTVTSTPGSGTEFILYFPGA